MNRLILSFFITLLIYILLFFIIKTDLQKPYKLPPKKRFNINSLRLLKEPKKSSQLPKTSIKHQKYTPQKTSLQPLKKRAKKKKLIKKVVKKSKTSSYVRKKSFKKRVKEHNKTIASKTVPSLSALFAKKAAPKKEPISKEIKKLYKDEFATFTKEQQKFIKNNLSKIGLITQKYLYLRGYPYIAIKTRQEGVNIVQFYLHPNGDISDLTLIKSSGYEALDKNSIETIKAAYKDYPLPQQKTKIKIYVHYNIIY